MRQFDEVLACFKIQEKEMVQTGNEENSRDVVREYIEALSTQKYDVARECLVSKVKVFGPSGEAFREADDFIGMLSQNRGGYDVMKVFVDGEDVCVLYDFITPKKRVYMSSWYHVTGDKIDSIRTVFDPAAFNADP